MMRSIGDILSTLPGKEKVKEYALWKTWGKLVGSQIAEHCRPDRLKDGTLFLKVDSPVWAQQLQFMKSMIIEKANDFMGSCIVKDLRFQVGRIGPTRRANWKPWKEISLTQEVLKRIDNDLSQVLDSELREVLKKLRIKEAQVKTWQDQRHKGTPSNNSPL